MDPSPTLVELLFPRRDVRLSAVIDELSEAPTGPSADNFVSNEDSYPRVAGDLERLAPKGGAYLGVGPDQNFTFLAHCAPKLGIIADFRRRNALLHLLHKALVSLSPGRVAYLSRLTARLPETLSSEPTREELVDAFTKAKLDRKRLDDAIAEVRRFLEPLKVVHDDEWDDLASIQSRLAGPGLEARFLALKMYPTLGRMIGTDDRESRPAHWLAREETYQFIRTLQRGDLVIPIVQDFAADRSFTRLRDWLNRTDLFLSVLYISDVEFFLMRHGRFRAYVESLARLPWHKDALLIRTSTREIAHPDRIRGDSSTTVLRRVDAFLEAALQDRIRTLDDLFAAH
ncbi:hypothetical protein [Singulisphaera sp. PoT]|uniref:LIC_10091 family protein n=1 Tax=Singulisphaera sp. PoT TaxID=3411797 RepID=UPI003BF545C6